MGYSLDSILAFLFLKALPLNCYFENIYYASLKITIQTLMQEIQKNVV